MLNVWTRTDGDRRNSRTVVAGNRQLLDPTEHTWTAQAEPSAILIATKLALTKGVDLVQARREWRLIGGHHFRKGGTRHCPATSTMGCAGGIVRAGALWPLQKAVYGLRQSPK